MALQIHHMSILPILCDNGQLSERSTELIAAEVLEWSLVGSRVSCSPPPQETDLDVLCRVGNMGSFADILLEEGYERGGSDPADVSPWSQSMVFEGRDNVSKFSAFRFGDLNIIATDSQEFYDKFMLATRVATKLNLMKKDDRIALFQAILYGNG